MARAGGALRRPRRFVPAALAAAAAVAIPAVPARGHGGAVECAIAPEAGANFFEARFRMAPPPGRARGAVVLVPGTDGDGRGWAEASEWRDWAHGLGWAVVGCHFRGDGAVDYPRAAGGSGGALLRALGEMGAATGQPGFGTVPVVVYGHSAGAEFAWRLAAWRPDLVRGFVAAKPGGFQACATETGAVCVAGLVVAGELDEPGRLATAASLFLPHRNGGHRWCFAWEAGRGHEPGRAPVLGRAFLEPIMREAGGERTAVREHWGDLDSLRWRVAKGRDAPADGVWLPSGEAAREWAAISRPVSGGDWKAMLAGKAGRPGAPAETAALDFGDVAWLGGAVTAEVPLPVDAVWAPVSPAAPAGTVRFERAADKRWTAVFNPSGLDMGRFRAEARFREEGGTRECAVWIQARVAGFLVCRPSGIYFGVVPAGATEGRTVEVRADNGAGGLVVESVEISPEGALRATAERRADGAWEVRCEVAGTAGWGNRSGWLRIRGARGGEAGAIRVPFILWVAPGAR